MLKEIEEIGIYYKTETPRPIFCTAIVATFFLPNPFDTVSEAVAQALQYYTDHIPEGAVRWQNIGANNGTWKSYTDKTLRQCLTHLRPPMVKKRPMTAVKIKDGVAAHDPARYSFMTIGDAKNITEYEGQLSLVQCRWPLARLDESNELLQDIKAIAVLLPYEYGYVSPEWSLGEWSDAPRSLLPYAQRYPGYDIQRNDMTRCFLSGAVRGARWMTFLGPVHIKKLGGIKKIESALNKNIQVDKIKKGLLIQAGDLPEIGDKKKEIDTPLLKEVARLLRPITRFDETELLGLGWGEDQTRAADFLDGWERRFL